MGTGRCLRISRGIRVQLHPALQRVVDVHGKRAVALPPPTLLTEVPGGFYLALDLLAAIMSARDGRGKVVDAADSVGHSLNILLSPLAVQGKTLERGGPGASTWFSRSYRCAGGEWINLSTYDQKFFGEALTRHGLGDDERFKHVLGRPEAWPQAWKAFESVFARKTRDQ